MAITEQVVAAVVAEVSKQMGEPSYAQVAVGSFVEAHPDVGRYVSAQARELGGTDGVVHTIFHAHVMASCFERALGADLPKVRFRDLDRVAKGDSVAELVKREPSIADYLASNVDLPAMRELLARVALAFDLCSLRSKR